MWSLFDRTSFNHYFFYLKRFSVLTTAPSSKTNWDKKMELKQEKLNIKKAQANLKEVKKQLYPPRPVTEILFS